MDDILSLYKKYNRPGAQIKNYLQNLKEYKPH